MNADGSNPHRISGGDGRYSTPVWSPRGDYIAFTKQLGGRFLIGVMRPDGSGERILTEGFHNEGPTWAPNGRVLMFFRESPGAEGGPQIYLGRSDRLQRAQGSDPVVRLRSGVVSTPQLKGGRNALGSDYRLRVTARAVVFQRRFHALQSEAATTHRQCGGLGTALHFRIYQVWKTEG